MAVISADDMARVQNRGPAPMTQFGGGDMMINPNPNFDTSAGIADYLNSISQGTAGTFGTNVPFQFNPTAFQSPVFDQISGNVGGANQAIASSRDARQQLINSLISGNGASQAFQQQGFDDSLAANLALARGAGGNISAANQRVLGRNVAADQSRVRNEAAQIRQQELSQALSGLLGGQQLEQGLLATSGGAAQQGLENQQNLQKLLADELFRSRQLQEQRAARRSTNPLIGAAIQGGAAGGAALISSQAGS